jgi:ABC-type multidrug transport system ATPase subunit
MIECKSGRHQVWSEFALNIRTPLRFEQGCRYHLHGDNGSGKSSFINRILLPLLKDSSCYILLFEQQLALQLHAIKAHAAIFNPKRSILNESDMIRYLYDDLAIAYLQHPKDTYIISDESHYPELLLRCSTHHCLIYTSHNVFVDNAQQVRFDLVNPELSEVYV